MQSTEGIYSHNEDVFHERREPSISLYHGMSHRTIVCQHHDGNCGSNCTGTVGNCILAVTPEEKKHLSTPAYNVNST